MNNVFPLSYFAAMRARMDIHHVWNLLDLEIDPAWRQKWPMLQYVSGHRQREVYHYIQATNPRWDEIIADGLWCNRGYVVPIGDAFEYQARVPPQFRGVHHYHRRHIPLVGHH